MPEQADNMQVIDRVTDQNSADSDGDINRSLWDELKVGSAGAVVGRREARADELENQSTLEFGLRELYSSIHDRAQRVVSESRTVSESGFAAGNGATGDSARLTVDGKALDAAPPQDVRYRDVISDSPVVEMRTQDVIQAAPSGERLEPKAGDEIEKLFKQLLGEPGDGAILASTPSGDRGQDAGQGRSEMWDKRAFLVHEDGSAEYTVKPGDTLWDVARDVLKHEHHGHKPTAREIREEVNRIAGENGIENVSKIEKGQTLHISSSRHESGHKHAEAADHGDHNGHEAKKGKSEESHESRGSDKKSAEAGNKVAEGDKKPASAGDGERAADKRSRDGASKQVDPVAMERAAEAINKACNEGFLWGAGTDKETVFAILKNTTEAERKELGKVFEQKYGHSLEAELRDELSGADLDKALNLLNRKGGDAGDAGRIQTALIERDQAVSGRTDANCEKDIRDTLATMSSKQIEELKHDYKALAELKNAGRSREELEREGKPYFEPELEKALSEDKNLSKATKDAIRIYLAGTDNRHDADTTKLADIAIKAHNIDMFAEAFRNSTPEARKAFLDSGGDQRLQEAFGTRNPKSGQYDSTPALEHAREIAEKGDLSHATLIRENASWAGDNEKAIERELTRLTPDERRAYAVGRELAQGHDVDNVTPREKQEALKFYKETHEALEKAGNASEVIRWDDMIVNGKETLVGKLAAHGCGTVFNDSTGQVLSTIEKMNPEDWQRYKDDPRFREQVGGALMSYAKGDDLDRCNALLEKMTKCDTFKKAQEWGHRSVFETIADNPAIPKAPTANADQVLDAIARMNQAELKLYRDDPQYRATVDKQIEKALPEAKEHLAAAHHMLDQVRHLSDDQIRQGKKPTDDIVVKLYRHAAEADTDEAQVIRDLRSALKADDKLAERLRNPSSEESKALHLALDDGEYKRYAEPLIKDGRLPIDVLVELNKGTINDDEKGFYKDVLSLATATDDASIRERGLILVDKDYREKVLGALSADEREVAMTVLVQGEMRPEDKLRAAMLGCGTDTQAIDTTFAELKEQREQFRAQLLKGGASEAQATALVDEFGRQQKEHVQSEYARKYKSDLTADLIDELGGRDKDAAKRELRPDPASAREAFNDARDEAYKSRDGVGKAWVDHIWDGTGYQTDAELNAYAKAMAAYSGRFEEMPEKQRKEMTEKLTEALELYKQSKEAAADRAVDGLIMTAGVVAAPESGGVSLELLAYAAAAGAAVKVGVKSAIQGEDYQLNGSDVATGAIDAMTAVPLFGQIGKLGEQVAVSAASKLVNQEGKLLLKEGTEEALQEGMKKVMTDAMAHGARTLDDKAIEALAREVAKDGHAEAVQAAIKKHLMEANAAAAPEAKSALRQFVKELATHSAEGAAVGGLAGGVHGAAEWDSSKSLSENLKAVAESAVISGSMGAAIAGAFTLGFRGLPELAEHVKGVLSKEVPHFNPESEVRVNGQKLEPNGEPVHIGRGNVGGNHPDVSTNHLSLARDAEGHVLVIDHSTNGTYIKRAGSEEFERIPSGKPTQLGPGDEVRLGSPEGAKLELESVRKLHEYAPHADGRDPVSDPASVAQSNELSNNHEIRAKLRDGFQMVDGANRYDEFGRFQDSRRFSTVVDRTQDGTLKQTIAEAHERFDHLKDKPEELAAALNKYSKETMTPKGWTEEQVDKAYVDLLNGQNSGKQLLLGEFIDRAARGEGGGVCAQQALLLKVLGDEFGLDVKFVAGVLQDGSGAVKPGAASNHAWTEVEINGRKHVFDPRQEIQGDAFADGKAHRPAKDAFRWSGLEQPEDLGSVIRVDGKQYYVLGAIGDDVLLRRAGTNIDLGEPLHMSSQDLATHYRPVGETGYYTDGHGNYFIPRDSGPGGIELVQDLNMVSMKHESIAHPTMIDRAGDKLRGLDGDQLMLRDGELTSVRKPYGADERGNMGHDMYYAVIKEADGTERQVILRETAGHPATADRMRKEAAAYKLGQMLDLDNGFPATVERDFVVDGKVKHGYIQDASGKRFQEQSLDGGIVDLANKRYPGSEARDAVSRLVKEDPEIRKQVEEAFVERLIYGDIDGHPLNMLVVKEPNALTGAEIVRVQNIDLDYGFPSDKTPDWGPWSGQGVNGRLQADFAQQPLSSDAMQKVERFIRKYDTPEGRADLSSAGLKPEEIEGVLGRARWLASDGKFPKVKSPKEWVMDHAEQSKQ